MSNLTDFFPSSGGGLTPKFYEFNASGSWTPPQALIDAGGYIELFLVGGGGGSALGYEGAAGGETILTQMYLTNTTAVAVVIGAGGSAAQGGTSVFQASLSGGVNVGALGGKVDGEQINRMGAGYSAFSSSVGSPGNGILGYGSGSAIGNNTKGGITTPKANSGQGGRNTVTGGSGYCLIKWYE